MASGQDAVRKVRDRLRGIHAILPTPFLDDWSLDLAGLSRNIEAVLAQGVQGVLVGGGYGEFPSLSTEERRHLIREAVRAVAGRVPVIACTAHSSTLEALELTHAAEEAGADAAMLTPPYVTEVREADVERHFAFIASRAAIPLVLYNTPSTGVVLSPALIARLAEIPTVVGVKQGVLDAAEMAAVVEAVGERLTVLCGSDTVMVAGLAVGMGGVTSTNASAFPDLIVAVYQAARRGDWGEARRLHDRWAPFRAFARRVGQPAAVKAAMDLAGLAGGACRPPLRALGAAEREELRAVLEGIGVVGVGPGEGA
ncbi:MAG: dihydrodipicolinate synthase family protein [Armatimonadota bacterium]|nr:dihydrodipicolinate synthase family protein [Armatimonadota bacterium]MDR7460422.1 dihydrodipicolinate synthase family protein [Armatimonadota bacterium]MDR7480563.1 dihydrodipicolinate synthase family protein [Armatimonadota bacterium]MDR7489253.1 dihydrodipicolinate synthase family protein [Armatimonadota bacterium]MDR7491027.1 dihydrodipicolinate synthase family protein [Armatimonadota bacterium]